LGLSIRSGCSCWGKAGQGREGWGKDTNAGEGVFKLGVQGFGRGRGTDLRGIAGLWGGDAAEEGEEQSLGAKSRDKSCSEF